MHNHSGACTTHTHTQTHMSSKEKSQVRWHVPLIPELQRQMILCEFEVNLVYIMGFRATKLHRPYLKNQEIEICLEMYVREFQSYS